MYNGEWVYSEKSPISLDDTRVMFQESFFHTLYLPSVGKVRQYIKLYTGVQEYYHPFTHS